MEAFSEEVRCIKCGGMQASVAWVLHREARPVARENLIRTCRRCGYSWPQMCLDDPALTDVRCLVKFSDVAREQEEQTGTLEKYKSWLAEGFR